MLKKKKPGRPPKKIIRASIPREGVQETPSVEEDIPQLQYILEFYYDNPMIFKKMIVLFKNMDSKHANIYFRKDKIIFLATDFKGNNHIYSEILGNKVNKYYIEEEFNVGINMSSLILISSKITREYQSIKIQCTRTQKEEQIEIILYNDKLDNPTISKINLEKTDPALNIVNIEKSIAAMENYPIKFVLDTKTFKRKINNALTFGPKLRIEKDGDGPLKFITDYKDCNGEDTDIFQSSAKINLVSTIEDDLFSATVYLSYLKALANALIADDLHIAVAKYDYMVFTAYLDSEYEDSQSGSKKDSETCIIRVFTQIIDFRNLKN
jgi:hypothetical protein